MPKRNISNKNKKAVMVIAFREFRDVEYFIPREILTKAGVGIVTCSSQKGTAIGADGGDAKVDFLAPDIRVDDFDAVIFIGGSGMGKNLDNVDFQSLAKEAVAKDKVLAAICIAPVLLAKAGLLAGKKATVWSDFLDMSAIEILERNGAKYTGEDVTADGKIITADGPLSAKHFGEAILELLTGK